MSENLAQQLVASRKLGRNGDIAAANVKATTLVALVLQMDAGDLHNLAKDLVKLKDSRGRSLVKELAKLRENQPGGVAYVAFFALAAVERGLDALNANKIKQQMIAHWAGAL